MLAESEDLQDTADGKRLQDEWNEVLNRANMFAVEGDAVGLKDTLGQYLKISSKYAVIATLFGWCYMAQLENALKNGVERFKIENGIRNYMLHFGLQDQIENFYNQFKEKYPNAKINLDQLTEGSILMWRPSMIVDSILDEDS